jgi:hypothetical protein
VAALTSQVTIIDNFSRGNHGAIEVLKGLAPKGKLRVVNGDLGVKEDVERAFAKHPVNGRGLSLAYNRPRVYASSQLF